MKMCGLSLLASLDKRYVSLKSTGKRIKEQEKLLKLKNHIHNTILSVWRIFCSLKGKNFRSGPCISSVFGGKGLHEHTKFPNDK